MIKTPVKNQTLKRKEPVNVEHIPYNLQKRSRIGTREREREEWQPSRLKPFSKFRLTVG